MQPIFDQNIKKGSKVKVGDAAGNVYTGNVVYFDPNKPRLTLCSGKNVKKIRVPIENKTKNNCVLSH